MLTIHGAARINTGLDFHKEFNQQNDHNRVTIKHDHSSQSPARIILQGTPTSRLVNSFFMDRKFQNHSKTSPQRDVEVTPVVHVHSRQSEAIEPSRLDNFSATWRSPTGLLKVSLETATIWTLNLRTSNADRTQAMMVIIGNRRRKESAKIFAIHPLQKGSKNQIHQLQRNFFGTD